MKAQLRASDSNEERAEIQTVIDRVELILDLLQTEEDLQNGSTRQRSADATTQVLLNQLVETFDESDAQSLDAGDSGAAAPRTGTTNFQTSTQTKFNCDTISTQTGYNWGTVTGIDFVESYVVAVQGYPDSIAVMQDNNCTVKDFDNGYVKFRNVSAGKMCTAELTHADDVDQGYCAKFGSGNPVLITAYAWYDDRTPFNTLEGWDFIWVP